MGQNGAFLLRIIIDFRGFRVNIGFRVTKDFVFRLPIFLHSSGGVLRPSDASAGQLTSTPAWQPMLERRLRQLSGGQSPQLSRRGTGLCRTNVPRKGGLRF